MKKYMNFIAPQGQKYVLATAFAFVFFLLLGVDTLAFVFLLAVFGIVFIFRKPPLKAEVPDVRCVLSMVDGTITKVETLQERNDAVCITIESTHFDKAILRAPMNACLREVKIVRGTRVSKKSPLFSSLNEYAQLIFEDDSKNSVEITHRLKTSCFSLEIDAHVLDTFAQEEVYGFAHASLTTIILPKEFSFESEVGTKVAAGESLLGFFTE